MHRLELIGATAMSGNKYSLDCVKSNADNQVISKRSSHSNHDAYVFFQIDGALWFALILLSVSIQMARKLTILEVLLIIYFLIVLILDVLLLMLVLEKPGKGDACGCWVGRTGKRSPLRMPKRLLYSFTLQHTTTLRYSRSTPTSNLSESPHDTFFFCNLNLECQ